jgi:hypothetical protein
MSEKRISANGTFLLCALLPTALPKVVLAQSLYDCSAMLSVSIPNAQITSATVVGATGPLPAHCRVVGVSHGEPGSNVGVEVRLPDGWNGKLLMTTPAVEPHPHAP